jgi:hypothetical protein
MTDRFCTLCQTKFTTLQEFQSHRCYEGDSKDWAKWIKEKKGVDVKWKAEE